MTRTVLPIAMADAANSNLFLASHVLCRFCFFGSPISFAHRPLPNPTYTQHQQLQTHGGTPGSASSRRRDRPPRPRGRAWPRHDPAVAAAGRRRHCCWHWDRPPGSGASSRSCPRRSPSWPSLAWNDPHGLKGGKELKEGRRCDVVIRRRRSVFEPWRHVAVAAGRPRDHKIYRSWSRSHHPACSPPITIMTIIDHDTFQICLNSCQDTGEIPGHNQAAGAQGTLGNSKTTWLYSVGSVWQVKTS